MSAHRLEVFIFPPSPYCRALMFFLREADIPFQVHPVDLRKKEQFSEGFQNINPFQRTPAIRMGDFHLFETTSILRFLADKFQRHRYFPKEALARARMDALMEHIAQQVIPQARELAWQRQVFPKAGRPTSKDIENRAEGQLLRALGPLENSLEEGCFLHGDQLTLADFLLTPALAWHEIIELDLTPFPKLKNWLAKITKLPSWIS